MPSYTEEQKRKAADTGTSAITGSGFGSGAGLGVLSSASAGFPPVGAAAQKRGCHER